MGERGNIFVVDPFAQEQQDSFLNDRGLDPNEFPARGVYLYSHWGGYDLPSTLAKALNRGRGRWDDSQYLTRIIFSEMIKDSINGETGYGLSAIMHDNEHPVLRVRWGNHLFNGVVEVMEPGTESSWNDNPLETYTFEQFVDKHLT